ncbi:MAG: YerC/YecD family TrpR-related protein [Patescibacteria group bacterium]|jgi:TrpR-related protein YerC/YecD
MEPFKFNKKTDSLFTAILSLKSVKECEAFFRDLCTIEELRGMSERWAIVALLDQGLSYREIAAELKVSTTTVSRVANWFYNGLGGYRSAIDRQHHQPSFKKRR